MDILSTRSIEEDPAATARADTHGTHVWWLLTHDTVGARKVVVNIADLPPGTAHQLHRHPHAEQATLVLSGWGLQLGPGGDPVVVNQGDAVFVPAGEWHGFANTSNAPVVIANIYGGVGSREDAGYELHPGPHFDPRTSTRGQERRVWDGDVDP